MFGMSSLRTITAVTLLMINSKSISGIFSYTFSPATLPLLFDGDNVTFHLSIQGLTEDILISALSSNEDIFGIRGNAQFPVRASEDRSSTTEQNVTIPVTLDIRFIGRAAVDFSVQTIDIFSISPYNISTYPVTATAKTHTIRLVSTYLLLIWLCLSYATMGTTMRWSEIKPLLYRPQGILIGIACQFIIMPGLSFLIAKALGLESSSAIGLILVGTCPGGWLSNVYTALLECDLVLSVTMTFFSTILALGLMPLNLLLYATPFTGEDENLRTPYGNLITQLALLVVPVFCGMFISYRFPKVARVISKLIKPVATLVILLSLGTGIPGYVYVLRTPAHIWLASALLPVIGGVLGLLIAKMTCLANKSSVTVALETGCQNSFLAVSIATLSYQRPESDLIGLAPILVGVLTLLEGSTLVVIYLLMTKFPGRSGNDEGIQATDEGRVRSLLGRMKLKKMKPHKGSEIRTPRENRGSPQRQSWQKDEGQDTITEERHQPATSSASGNGLGGIERKRRSRRVNAGTQTDYEELLRLQSSYVNPSFLSTSYWYHDAIPTTFDMKTYV